MKGKPQVVKAEAPKRAATSDEVLRAIDALSDAENERIEQFAINRIHRIGRAAAGRDHEDLLQDAVTSLINGPRHWYPEGGVSFAECLLGAVRSVSSAWAGHRKRNADSPRYAGLDSELSLKTDEGRLASPFERIASPVLNAEENAVRATEIAEAQKLADAIFESFADDEPATYVLMGFEDGLTGPEIRAALNMSEPQYRTVTRKIQRRAKKIMDEFYGR
jgi:DNA-directed RNA polymerase specialized sigma24 family protein